jgi:hypothetical protein
VGNGITLLGVTTLIIINNILKPADYKSEKISEVLLDKTLDIIPFPI